MSEAREKPRLSKQKKGIAKDQGSSHGEGKVSEGETTLPKKKKKKHPPQTNQHPPKGGEIYPRKGKKGF